MEKKQQTPKLIIQHTHACAHTHTHKRAQSDDPSSLKGFYQNCSGLPHSYIHGMGNDRGAI